MSTSRPAAPRSLAVFASAHRIAVFGHFGLLLHTRAAAADACGVAILVLFGIRRSKKGNTRVQAGGGGVLNNNMQLVGCKFPDAQQDRSSGQGLLLLML